MNDILKSIFEKLKDKRPVFETVDGQPYAVQADGTLGQPIRPLAPQWSFPTLRVRTLSALVEAYEKGIDGLEKKDVAFLVSNYDSVQLVSLKADDYGRRHIWADASHTQETPFNFGQYYLPEAFYIAFRASFHLTDAALKVLTLVSGITSSSSVTVADDGYSQRTEIKQGLTSTQAVDLPTEIPLVPWRSFHEARLVESKYMLRLKGNNPGQLPTVGLFEVDGKWRKESIDAIADWLKANAKGAVVFN